MKIFITGGTTGIGISLAESYLKDGHTVGICGRDLAKLPADFLTKYPRAQAYTADVTERELLQKCIRDFAAGELDLLIANAGISMGSKTTTPDFAASRRIIDTNVLGVYHSFEEAFNLMQPRGKGHMVAIASVAGFMGLPGAGAYSASKAAVLRLCESFAIDFKQFGIDITAIAPGFIKTPLTDKNDHAMPFIISAECAVEKIKKSIAQKKVLAIFPWRMKIVVYILEKMPRRLYRWIMTAKMANYSKG